jgi:sugar/nucleoside kinase (ribokinase family)
MAACLVAPMSNSPQVLCAGILVADHVCTPISHLPGPGELVLADRLVLTLGGCAANVAVDLSRMGVQAEVAGRVGDDVFGRIVADLLRENHVDVSGLGVSPGQDTSQTLIVNVAGQDRRFIHTFGANAIFSATDIPHDRSTRCQVLYLGGYLLMGNVRENELASVFHAARAAGARTVLDVVTPGPSDYLPRLVGLLPHVDVFLPNNQEAELICGEKDPIKQAEFFHRLGAGTSIITLGGEGSILVNDRQRLRAGAFSIPFVDGTGGGDAFCAGYICGMLWGYDAANCLRIASALGASCVRAIGTTAGVFTRPECEAFLRQQSLTIEAI